MTTSTPAPKPSGLASPWATATVAALGGLGLALSLPGWLDRAGLLDPPHGQGSFLGGLAAIVGLTVGGFALGAYLGATAWIAWRRLPASPGRIVLGACGGFLMGMVASVPLQLLPSAWSVPASGLAQLGCAWGGARLAAARPAPLLSPRGAMIRTALSLVASALLVFMCMTRDDFPGAAAPLAARDAWARQALSPEYERAVACLRASAPLRRRLGRVTAVAPTAGRNATVSTPGEVLSELTLEVVGERAHGLASLHVQHGGVPTGWAISGTVTVGLETIAVASPFSPKARSEAPTLQRRDPKGRNSSS